MSNDAFQRGVDTAKNEREEAYRKKQTEESRFHSAMDNLVHQSQQIRTWFLSNGYYVSVQKDRVLFTPRPHSKTAAYPPHHFIIYPCLQYDKPYYHLSSDISVCETFEKVGLQSSGVHTWDQVLEGLGKYYEMTRAVAETNRSEKTTARIILISIVLILVLLYGLGLYNLKH